MFVWAPIPEAYSDMDSVEFCSHLVRDCNVALSPGAGFGPGGEGFAGGYAGEEFVLDEAAGFVDAPGGVDGVAGFVEFGEGGVEDGAEAGEPGGIGFRVDGEDFFSAGGSEDFGKGDTGEVAVFLEQPVDELGGVGVFFGRGGGAGLGVD